MDKFVSSYITLRVLVGSYLSEINTVYSVTLSKSEASSLSSLLFSTFDNFKLILEYYGLIRYKDNILSITVDKISHGKDCYLRRLLNDYSINHNYFDKTNVSRFEHIVKTKLMFYIGLINN